ncbi:hypothetical protein Tco_0037299 [Tanacetum coccineum]
MLGENNITYRPRTSVKGHILADFLVEKPNENPPDTPVVETPLEPWTLFTDGSSCVDGSGAKYLKNGTLSGERKEASKLHIKARQYELLEGVLYKRSFLKPWLSQSYAARILLANYAPGCMGDDSYVQRLSNTSTHAKKSPIQANPNHDPMVILQVGN